MMDSALSDLLITLESLGRDVVRQMADLNAQDGVPDAGLARLAADLNGAIALVERLTDE